MPVNQTSKSVRQAEGRRPERHAERIRQKLGDEINARLVSMPDVGSDIEKTRACDRLEQQFPQPPAGARPQPAQAERDQTHKRFAIPQIEFKRHFVLQNCRVHFVMDEQGMRPIAKE